MLVFYISGHGFGHASRDIEVLNELGRRHPEIPVTVRTSAPRWFFDLTLTRSIDWQPAECDTGVVQVDSLHVDEHGTIARAREFYRNFDERVAKEAIWLRSRRAALVVGDIPPIAFAAAKRADLPAIAIGNFTWDWIYDGYAAWASPDDTFIDRIRDAYRDATIALRLPMAGGFDTLDRIVDLPFVARRSRRAPEEVRRQLDLPTDTSIVLLSFGGYGLTNIDFARAATVQGYTILTTADVTASRRGDQPPGRPAIALPSNVRLVDETDLYARGWRYEDLVAVADAVITKPGFGIVAECVANDTAVLYTSRGHFVEYDVLVREMPRWLRCRFLSNAAVLGGDWQEALDELLDQPPPPERIGIDGAERAATLIAMRYQDLGEREGRN
jgi:hypothetical protein